MFNLFKREKKYKEVDIQVSYYKKPSLIFDSLDNKYVKIEDLIVQNHGSLAKISDNGVDGIIDLKSQFEGKTLLAKYGYAVFDDLGNITYCSSIKNCIGNYLSNQRKLQNHPSMSIINPGKLDFNITEVSKGFGITAVSNVEYPIILEFLKNDSMPILFNGGEDILSNRESLFGYSRFKDSFSKTFKLEMFPPKILHGAFYLDVNPVSGSQVIYNISEYLLCSENIKISMADVKKVDKSTIEIGDYIFYLDDVSRYSNFESYLSETKSIRRNKKLDILLTNSENNSIK